MSEVRRSLTGHRALVTGSSQRLGRHLALSLARAGSQVVVHYRYSRSEALTLVEEIQDLGSSAWAVHADLEVPGEAERLVESAASAAGALDILVNNVGNYTPGSLRDSTPDEWRSTLETNLIAPHALIRSFVEQCPSSGGHVVNLGYAGVDVLRSNPQATAYQISKTGMLILTKSWAEVLGKRGIRVNMISPGHLDNSIDLPADLSSAIPLGRAGRAEDVEDALHWLLDFDGYVTGVNVDVAGGYRL